MKPLTSLPYSVWLIIGLLFSSSASASHMTDAFKQYWFAGDAELTSYDLKQSRYGELNEGNATLIFVTEQLLPKVQVKADRAGNSNVPVIKLNKHKSFLTGIYPYNIMTSTFSPLENIGHAVKISNTTQEWCGNAYYQINNRAKFDVTSHSYFEGEADKDFQLDKHLLEDEIWTKIRLDPTSLPTGKIQLIPSLEYARLRHIELRAYTAQLTLEKQADVNVYRIDYPSLKRTLSIRFQNTFPYIIEGWEDTYLSGFGEDAKVLTSTATKKSTIKEKYWELHNNRHKVYRDKLGLSR